jgi:pyruvate/2-oxoglutarate dehydrogenase complex dihydrolipoamide dehydrogenase (E3) component
VCERLVQSLIYINMAESTEYDLVVIGGGPAGYAGAIRAGQLGKKVACIEMERAGGTCLNWGCIPTKALLKSAELYQKFKKAEVYGLSVKEVSFDFAKVMERSRGVAGQMAKGIEFLFKKNKVDYFVGRAQVAAANMVAITEGEHKGKFLRAKNILIATGCKMRHIPGLEYDGVKVMTSREALANTKLPKSVIIVGAGAIGVEFAYFYNAFGAKVTLVEMLPQVLPVEDEEVAKTLHRSFEKQGMTVHVNTKCENFRVGKSSVKIDLVTGDKKTEVEADLLLSAIGVVANIEGVIAPAVKIELDRNYVKVGDDYQTNVKGIYAAGDIIGPPWLAPCGDLRGGQRGQRHVRPRHAEAGEGFSGLHLLPAAGCEHGADREGREGKGPGLQGRQISVHRVGQGRGLGGERRLREGDHRRQDRRDLRRAHHRQRGDRADRRVWAGHGAGGDGGGDSPDHPRPSDPERGEHGGLRGLLGRGDPYLRSGRQAQALHWTGPRWFFRF